MILWWIIGVFGIIFTVIIMFPFLKLKIHIDYYHGNDNDHLVIIFQAFFNLLKYKVNVPVIKVADGKHALVYKQQNEVGQQEKDSMKETQKFTVDDLLSSIQDMQHILEHVVGFHKIIRTFFKKTSIKSLTWQSSIGVGDAALTGMLMGAIWSAKGCLIGFISSLMKMETTPQLMITPDFNGVRSITSFSCMIQFRIGHAILVGIKAFKYWKGGKPHFKSKSFSVLTDKPKSV